MNGHFLRKIKSLVFLCVLSLGLNFAVQAFAETQASPDFARIMGSGKIVVAMTDLDSPPFFMSDAEGNMSGIDVELARSIGENLGVKVEFNRKAKTFNEVVEMVAAREADISISYLSETLERAKKVIFTKPYMIRYRTTIVNRLAIAQRKWGKNPLEGLNHKTVSIGALKGSSHFAFAQKTFPLAVMVPFDTREAAAEAAKTGKVQAAFFDDMFVERWSRSFPDAVLYLQTIVFKDKEDPIGIAVHWEDTHLREWLNQFVGVVTKDGTVDKLVTKYLESRK
ncbi:MAG: amino acid ABC transporter substrate-binding protein [Candidatus Omnitrophica bacterium]|nr:amino acid ABC transporter substrate-binding protein [Candidatus Omnitrophota bacterium]